MADGEQRYDVFLSHNSRDKPAVERIAELLKRAGLEPWLDKWCLTPGGKWLDEIAAGLRASAACAFFVGPYGPGAWAREELDIALDRAVKDRSFRLVLVLLPGVPEPFDVSSLPPFLSTRTWVDFRKGPHDQRALQLLINAVKGVAPGPEAPIEPRVETCPYRGLRTYDEEHAEFFFGRHADVQRLVEKLKGTRFLAVLGPSGSGKSSLVRAGLLPALRKGALPASHDWRVCLFTPGPRPLESLALHLARLHGQEDLLGAVRMLVEHLGADHRALHLATRLALVNSPVAPATPLQPTVLYVVDQAEELFTLCRDEQQRQQFIANLLHATAIPDSHCVVILTMRADFYHRCAAHPELAARIATYQFLVSPMDREALHQAIAEPAHCVGLEFEQGLVETILRDVAHRPGALPLLAHALVELWERRRGRMLTLEAYRECSGVEGAIAQRAEAVYSAFTPEQQAIARRALLRLTQPGEGTEDTRRRATMSELVTHPDEAEAVEGVVQALTDARLLTTTWEESTRERWVDVSHEALIHGWPRLREWLEEDRAGLRIHRRLTDAAQEWVRLNRDDGVLYRGARLAQAVEWWERSTPALNELEREFLTASLELKKREEEAEREQQRRELEAAQKLLAIEQQRRETAQRLADTERRARVRQRGFTIGLAALLGVATAAAVVAVGQYQDASVRRVEAESQRQIAEAQRAEADAQRARAENERQIARSRELAASALAQLGIDPELSLLLAAEAARLLPTAQAADALRQALLASHVRAVVRGHGGDVVGLALSPEGRLAVSAGADGVAQVWETASGQVVASLRGHSGPLSAAAFSPDGVRVVTASADGTARLWEVSSGRELLTLRGHAGPLTAASFSPDGRLVLTASTDGTARLWEAAGGELAAELRGHAAPIVAAEFSPDGKLALTASEDGTAALWQVGTGQRLARLSEHEGPLTGAHFSADGRLVVTTSHDETARLWEASTGRALRTLAGTAGSVTAAAFSPDGRWLATAGDDGGARIWPTGSDTAALALIGHMGAVASVAFSHDSRFVLTASADTTARVWDVRSGEAVAVLRGHQREVTAARFTPDDARVVTTSADGTARLWEAATGQEQVQLRGHTAAVLTLRFSPDGATLATAGADGSVRLWEVPAGRARAELAGHSGAVGTLAFSPDGTLLATGGQDGTARLWEVASGRALVVLGGHLAVVTAVAFSPDGTLLATASADGTAQIWDARSGGRLARLAGHTGSLTAVAFSPDGTLLATASADASARLWEVSSGRELARLVGHGELVQSVAFSPDGRLLATAGGDPAAPAGDNTARLWAVPSGRAVAVLRGHTGALYSAVFSPDGRLLATASLDGSGRVWDVASGALVAELRGHRAPLQSAAFSPDGRWVVTTSLDGSARVWEAGSGRELMVLRGHRLPLQSALFSPDGRWIATASQDGAAQLYACVVCRSLDEQLALVPAYTTRQLSPEERSRYLGEAAGG